MFGQTVVKIMSGMSDEEKKNVLCIDSDLEGSVGFKHIRAAHPDLYLKSGIMERGNFSACAGFGMKKGRQGVFATFAAFLEMCTSEITMARLNRSNVLCHFSHSGCDDMADNTCHFGLNNYFADNGLADQYVVFERSVRAWSSRISHFHTLLQEYHSHRSLIPQENYSNTNQTGTRPSFTFLATRIRWTKS